LGLDAAFFVIDRLQIFTFQVVVVDRAAGFLDPIIRRVVVEGIGINLAIPVVKIPGQRQVAIAADMGVSVP
jgi:hypothetical protein